MKLSGFLINGSPPFHVHGVVPKLKLHNSCAGLPICFLVRTKESEDNARRTLVSTELDCLFMVASINTTPALILLVVS